MNNLIDQSKDLLELQQLEAAIQTELDLNCQVLPRSSETPIDTLVVSLEPDEKERERIASIMFFPTQDSNIEFLKLLQFYCELPILIESDSMRASSTQLLSAINLKLPIGAFCLNSEHRLVFKYIYSLGKFNAIEPTEFLETFLLWMFAVDSMSSLVEAVTAGELTLDSAIQSLED